MAPANPMLVRICLDAALAVEKVALEVEIVLLDDHVGQSRAAEGSFNGVELGAEERIGMDERGCFIDQIERLGCTLGDLDGLAVRLVLGIRGMAVGLELGAVKGIFEGPALGFAGRSLFGVIDGMKQS